NPGAADGRVLAGLQVPEDELHLLAAALETIGYPYWDETENPAYQLFLGCARTPGPGRVAPLGFVGRDKPGPTPRRRRGPRRLDCSGRRGERHGYRAGPETVAGPAGRFAAGAHRRVRRAVLAALARRPLAGLGGSGPPAALRRARPAGPGRRGAGGGLVAGASAGHPPGRNLGAGQRHPVSAGG